MNPVPLAIGVLVATFAIATFLLLAWRFSR